MIVDPKAWFCLALTARKLNGEIPHAALSGFLLFGRLVTEKSSLDSELSYIITHIIIWLTSIFVH